MSPDMQQVQRRISRLVDVKWCFQTFKTGEIEKYYNRLRNRVLERTFPSINMKGENVRIFVQ